jgi:predicted dehydrogenase
MFIAGVSSITEPPVNDIWTIRGEENLLPIWQKQDADFFRGIDPMAHYHMAQIADFLDAVLRKRDPLITGNAARQTVELFTAIYRSQRDRYPIHFPLPPT